MNRRASTLLVIATAIAVTTSVMGRAARVRPAAASLVAGRAVDALTSAPIGGVVVTLGGRGGATQRTLAGGDGRFVFDGLLPGSYALSVAKPGYFSGSFDQRQPLGLGHAIDLADGRRRDDLVVRMWKQSVIGGAVIDERGAPMTGIDVRALRRTLLGGRWQMADVGGATTDDRGRFRLGGLAAGDITLVVRPPRDPETPLLLSLLASNPAVAGDVVAGIAAGGRNGPDVDPGVRHHGIAWFPAAPEASSGHATTVPPGGARENLVIRVQPARGVRLAGHISGLSQPGAYVESSPTTDVDVRLIALDSTGVSTLTEMSVAAASADGRFEMSGIPPGRYDARVLWTRPPPPAPPTITPGPPIVPVLPPDSISWARASINVGAADIPDLALTLAQGFPIAGRAVCDDAQAAPPDMSTMVLRFDSADAPAPAGGQVPPWRTRVEPDGRIVETGVPPGRYFVRVQSQMRGWTALSAMIGGRDALDEPIDIDRAMADVVVTFTSKAFGSVGGIVHDSPDRAAGDATVLLFPVDRALWQDDTAGARRLRWARPSVTGAYGIGNLPPGDYLLIALADEPPLEWQDPARLEVLSHLATQVHVSLAGRTTIDLTVVK